MKIFIDSANFEDIRQAVETGLVDGVTTNPSLIAQTGKEIPSIIEKICSIVAGPVSVEILSMDTKKMTEEGRKLSKIASNVIVKVPLTIEGLRTCEILTSDNISVNVTLCFSTTQALLAAKAGAAYVSPFIGRFEDTGGMGTTLLKDILTVYKNYHFSTQVLAASLRNPQHVLEAALLGANVATVPPKVFFQLFEHPLTQKGLDLFLKDAQSSHQII